MSRKPLQSWEMQIVKFTRTLFVWKVTSFLGRVSFSYKTDTSSFFICINWHSLLWLLLPVNLDHSYIVTSFFKIILLLMKLLRKYHYALQIMKKQCLHFIALTCHPEFLIVFFESTETYSYLYFSRKFPWFVIIYLYFVFRNVPFIFFFRYYSSWHS